MFGFNAAQNEVVKMKDPETLRKLFFREFADGFYLRSAYSGLEYRKQLFCSDYLRCRDSADPELKKLASQYETLIIKDKGFILDGIFLINKFNATTNLEEHRMNLDTIVQNMEATRQKITEYSTPLMRKSNRSIEKVLRRVLGENLGFVLEPSRDNEEFILHRNLRSVQLGLELNFGRDGNYGDITFTIDDLNAYIGLCDVFGGYCDRIESQTDEVLEQQLSEIIPHIAAFCTQTEIILSN